MSKLFSLNWKDLVKAFVLALIALILNFAIDYIVPNLGISPENKLLIIGVISYLLKNYFTGKNGNFFSKEEIVGGHPPKHPPR